MVCDTTRRMVSPYLDGELLDEDRGAFEEHAGACPGCRRSLQDEAEIVELLRNATLRESAPPQLRRSVRQLLATPQLSRQRIAWWLAGAASALLAVSLVGHRAATPGLAAGSAGRFVAAAVDTHLRFRRGQLPLEVRSDRPRTVSRWFSGKVPFEVTLPHYEAPPEEEKLYRLEGGRLVALDDDYAAHVAYRMAGEAISLLVTTAAHVTPSGGEVVSLGRLRFHVQAVAGLNVISWSDKGLTYALVSDLTVAGSRSCLVCHKSLEGAGRLDHSL